MKNNIIALICLLSVTMAYSQNAERTVITGNISYEQDSVHSVTLIVADDKNLIQPAVQHTTYTKSGFFSFELHLSTIRWIQFAIDGDDVMGSNGTGSAIVLEPGDSLHTIFPDKSSKISDLKFSGTGSQKQLLIGNISKEVDALIGSDEWKMEYPPDFEKVLQLDLLTLPLVEKSLRKDSALVDKVAWKYLRSKITERCHYAILESFLQMDVGSPRIQTLYKDAYLKVLCSSDMFSPDNEGGLLWQLVLEKNALVRHLMDTNTSIANFDKRDKRLMYNILLSAYGRLPICSQVLAGYIAFQGRFYGWDDQFESIVNDYMNRIGSGDPYRKQVEQISKSLERLKPANGQIVDFSLRDTTNHFVNLKDFRGKVVVLDFMFTGCGGCAILAPRLEAFQEKLANDQVVFVSISVDKTVESFKKGIGKFSSPGSVHVYTNGEGYDHAVVKMMEIIAYPTLVLIGKDGKVLDERAPKPSSAEGASKLRNLIEANL